jgi:hypothetical protein
MDRKLKQALWEDALTNGLNATEYGLMLTAVDNLLTQIVMNSQESLNGIRSNDYDIDGKEIKA